jgi:hypothetical protein
MSYRPITYCKSCNEPFDVYRDPDDRVCDSCLETMGEDDEPEEDCDRCNGSGLIARNCSSGSYRCAGPVPEDTGVNCYEDFCDCGTGMTMRNQERRARAR